MINEQNIIDFMSKLNYDIRESHNGRWIDQKCTPDVLSFQADCIYNFVMSHQNQPFYTQDIWYNDYTIQNTMLIFKKPSPTTDKAKNEYDKFFGQPLKLLGYSKVLNESKDGNKNVYTVNNLELLEYIAISERNALRFLHRYIEKVLSDSDLISCFEYFFTEQKKVMGNKDKLQDLYLKVKNDFYHFTKRYTPINGDLECGRIFSKVIKLYLQFQKS